MKHDCALHDYPISFDRDKEMIHSRDCTYHPVCVQRTRQVEKYEVEFVPIPTHILFYV